MTDQSKSCCAPKTAATNAAPELSDVVVRKAQVSEDVKTKSSEKASSSGGGCCCGPKS